MTIEQQKNRYARLKHVHATSDPGPRGRRSFLRSLLALSSVPFAAGTGSWLIWSKSVVIRDGWVLSSDD